MFCCHTVTGDSAAIRSAGSHGAGYGAKAELHPWQDPMGRARAGGAHRGGAWAGAGHEHCRHHRAAAEGCHLTRQPNPHSSVSLFACLSEESCLPEVITVTVPSNEAKARALSVMHMTVHNRANHCRACPTPHRPHPFKSIHNLQPAEHTATLWLSCGAANPARELFNPCSPYVLIALADQSASLWLLLPHARDPRCATMQPTQQPYQCGRRQCTGCNTQHS